MMRTVLIHKENNICTLTINRPKQYNALNRCVLEELDEAIKKIKNDRNCRALIITGTGDKAFIAGADIKEMINMDVKSAQEFSKYGQDITKYIENMHIPVIAAINGFALGGGCEFAMSCHIRFASTNAIFSQPEVALGLIAGFGGTQRLPRLIGKGRAMELLLSGKQINADEAYSIGLVNKVFEAHELLPKANELALLILKNAPLAIAKTIESINEGYKNNFIAGLKKEQTAFSKLFNSLDTAEGLSSFVEKRTPKYTGK